MLVYFALIATVLVGCCGLAVDVGRLELRTLQLQAAADAGALAAAGEMQHEPWNWQQAADTDIAALETANGLPATGTIAAQINATSGKYAGDYSTLQVTMTQPMNTIFMGVLSKASATMNVTVTAVAQMPPCFVFLGTPTINNGFNDGVATYAYKAASAGMDSNVNYWGCPVYAKTGFQIDGFAT